MFSFLGRENPALQLYGKLPVAKDYLRLGCGDGPSKEWREWLDQVFGTAREASEQLELGQPLRFLGQSSKDPLQGCVWPSSDAGGKRSFPFSLFVARKRKPLTEDLEADLAQAEGVWRVLAQWREDCLSAEDGNDLLTKHRGRELELAETEGVALAPADFDGWLEALWPDDRLDGLFALFTRIHELARGGHQGPYRLPLVRELPQRDQVLAWVRALRALGVLTDPLPTLFFSMRSFVSGGGLGMLVASNSPLSQREVEWLLPPLPGARIGPADFLADFEDDEVMLSEPPDGEIALRDSFQGALESFRSRVGEA